MFALARNADALDQLVAEIRATGGDAHAFSCDVTDSTSVEHTIKDILGRFDHVDYLVNNAGRSIRRSVVNSTDRLHDYERVMAVNYFGAVRMVLALLPHWRERRFGHVVNVSSAGVQARNPKYSSYLPTKAALDAFADVVSSETLSDHITFTNIHMPLVRTPMIAPSHRLNPVPAISPERAAAMVVRGLVEKPVAHRHPPGHALRGRQLLRAADCRGESCTSSTWVIPIRLPRAEFRDRSPTDGPRATPAEAPGPRRHRGMRVPERGQTCWCAWCPACTGSHFCSVN